jgi:hypothetical protein
MAAKERQQELLPIKNKANTDPWKHANNHTYECEADIKRLPVVHLTNPEIHRIHMIPRSYDERVKAGVHKCGFKLSSNSTGCF